MLQMNMNIGCIGTITTYRAHFWNHTWDDGTLATWMVAHLSLCGRCKTVPQKWKNFWCLVTTNQGIWHACRRHQMEAFSALLALCAGNSPVTGEFPSQQAEKRSLDAFFDLRLTNGLVNNRDAGGLRCHLGHYDVTVMKIWLHQWRTILLGVHYIIETIITCEKT